MPIAQLTEARQEIGWRNDVAPLALDRLDEDGRDLVDPTEADILIESLSGSPGVQDVQDQRGYLDQIFAVLNAASYTAIGVAGLMLVAAVLLIATTIRLSAFSRRRELGIMRLVGASNRFIQTPFILEGVFAALIGSVLAGVAVVAIVQFFVQGYLSTTLQSTTTLVGLGDALIVVPILIVVGAALAWLGVFALVAVPLSFSLIQQVWTTDGAALNPLLGRTAKLLLMATVVTSVAMVMGA
jgi:cell division transport system permease protein